MQVSAEIRWFWTETEGAPLKDWFCNGAGGGQRPRPDSYLRDPGQKELGIKLRGNKGTEVKGLVACEIGRITTEPFAGPIELWTKWSAETLKLEGAPLIKTEKLRWLRKFDTAGTGAREIALDGQEKPADGRELPQTGCNVELTRVTVAGKSEVWWTLGFEAFGTIDNVEASLRAAVTEMTKRRPPATSKGLLASYPVWLSIHG